MVFFIFIQILIEHSVSKQWRPRSDADSAAPDLGLHCLPMSYKKGSRFIWVKADRKKSYNVFHLNQITCRDALTLKPSKQDISK